MRLRTFRFLALGLAATICAAAAEALLVLEGTSFPAKIAGIPWAQASNFELEARAAGVAVSYRDEKLKADIYLYEASQPELLGRPLDERFAAAALSNIDIFKEYERQGIYLRVKISASENVKVGGLTFTRVKLTYMEQGEWKKSRLYLTTYRDRLLKFRITALEEVDDATLEKVFADAAGSFAKRA